VPQDVPANAGLLCDTLAMDGELIKEVLMSTDKLQNALRWAELNED
jgi:hypothetical protein